MASTKKKQPRLKAYLVNSEYAEDNTSIQYARHAITALTRGLNDLHCDTDSLAGSRCNRAPQLDQYGAAHAVPVSLLVSMGWWGFSCDGCGLEFDDEDALEEADLNYTDIIGCYHGANYCNEKCKSDHEQYEHNKKNFSAKALDEYKMKLELAHPKGIVYEGKDYIYVVQTRDGWVVRELTLDFRFPGSTKTSAQAKYRALPSVPPMDGEEPEPPRLQVYVPRDDHDAYNEWRNNV